MQDSGPSSSSDTSSDLTSNLADDRPKSSAVGSASEPPPGDSANLTLNITNPTTPSPGYELKPYLPDKQRDYVRLIVTVGLLLMLGWIIVWASIESASWPNHWQQTKEMLQIILPALTGLIGSVIGFYFGSGVNSSNLQNTPTFGSGR
jgi:hypothetical protein